MSGRVAWTMALLAGIAGCKSSGDDGTAGGGSPFGGGGGSPFGGSPFGGSGGDSGGSGGVIGGAGGSIGGAGGAIGGSGGSSGGSGGAAGGSGGAVGGSGGAPGGAGGASGGSGGAIGGSGGAGGSGGGGGAGECERGDTDQEPCGLNGRGIQQRICPFGQWADDGPCDDPDECVDGSFVELPCPDGGFVEQRCVAGLYDPPPECPAPGECVDGDIEREACGHRSSGVQERHCEDGFWSAFGPCAGACADDCDGGATRCAGDGVQACVEADDDPCLEWGRAVACEAGCEDGACVAARAPVINEVLYDAAGGDPAGVFIELWGPAGLSLEGYALVGVNGRDGEVFDPIPLGGAIPRDGYFVVAHTDAAGDVRAQADLLHGDADLQNGPDSVRLMRGDAVVDAVGYGEFGGAVFAGEGAPAPDPPEGQSITRDAAHTDRGDNARDFSPSVPSPGAAGGVAPAPCLGIEIIDVPAAGGAVPVVLPAGDSITTGTCGGAGTSEVILRFQLGAPREVSFSALEWDGGRPPTIYVRGDCEARDSELTCIRPGGSLSGPVASGVYWVVVDGEGQGTVLIDLR